MSDFKLAKIYKIEPVNPVDKSDIYIGSTCKSTLSQRLSGHRRTYKQWENGNYNNVSVFQLFKNYGIDNCNIYLIEEFPCETKDQLRKKEGYYISTIPCVNKLVAGRTKKESAKAYYENNIDHIKQYRDNHKGYMKEYRDNHKETISKWKNTKLKCICGWCYSRCNKSHHVKTLKHINYMTKHDDIMNTVNEIIASIKNDNLINN